MTPPINIIDRAIPLIAQAVTEWEQKNTAEVLTQRVHQLLDKSSKEVVMKLLGFNETWGKWELDHCNGRAGNSAAGDYLKEVQHSAIKDWLQTVSMPKLDKTVLTRLEKQAQSEYLQYINNEVRQLAHVQAQTDARELVTALTESKQIKNYLAAMQLISPSGEVNAS